ncbi:MAG: hypothetical protein AAGD11_06045 [Planctomycetota bacterium]
MDYFSSVGCSGFGLLWIAVHLFGLVAAWMVRWHTRRRFVALLQSVFFLSLLAVAATTMVGHVCCLEMWPLSGLTLGVMIVVAIVDLGVSKPRAIGLEG